LKKKITINSTYS